VQLSKAFFNRWRYGDWKQFSDTAFALIERALQLDPYNFEAHKAFGINHFYRGDMEKGVEHLQKALQINVNDSEVLFALGEYYMEHTLQFEKAISLLRKSFRNNPSLQADGFLTRIEYLEKIGFAYKSMAMYEEALRVEERAMALNPNRPPSYIGILFTLMGKFKEALPYYHEQYLKDTTNIFFTANLAEAHSWLNQWEMSERYFTKCMQKYKTVSPTTYNSFLLFRFAYTLSEQDKNEQASELFKKHKKIVNAFLDEGNAYPSLLYDLAVNNAYTGNTEEALNLLKDIPFWWLTYGLTRIDPMLDPIRDHPGFKEILNKQNNEILELRDIVNMDEFRSDLDWVLNR
jgi:tetratricopeptide (TPR) repeat protein